MSSKERIICRNFCCQRCCHPILLNKSFKDLNLQYLSELSTRLQQTREKRYQNLLVETIETDPRESADLISDFIIVDDFLVKDNFRAMFLKSYETSRVTATFFDVISDKSHIDHPLCEDCIDNLFDQMDQQLKTAEDELVEYKLFFEQLEVENDEDELEKLKEDLAKLQKHEAELVVELSSLEVKDQEVNTDFQKCEDELIYLKREERKRWHEYCGVKRQKLLADDSQRSVNIQLEYAQVQLDKLNKTNVFDASFHIRHNGQFGIINNFRLGRLTAVPVEWSEINAAWGQTVLLLHSLAQKVNLTFKKYRLVPYGVYSRIETLECKPKIFPLYSFSGSDRKFNFGMVVFLDCLQQFKNKVENSNTSFCLPYSIEKGRIIDKSTNSSYSIRLVFNSPEHWTKALKFMLTNLKWALAWVSLQFHDDIRS